MFVTETFHSNFVK